MKLKTKKKRPNSGKLTLVICMAVLVVLAAALLVVINVYRNNLAPVDAKSTKASEAFVVESGASANDVIDSLYKAALIRDVNAAKIYVKVKGISAVYAGNYMLSQTMSTVDIFNTITDESKAIVDQVEVTLLPGKWAKDYAAAIAEVTNLKADDILAKWIDVDYMYKLIDKYDFLTTDIFSSEHVFLEGYLTPDTYKFYAQTTIEQVTEKILDQTEAVYKQHKDEIDRVMAAKKLSLHDVYTMASIVMFEANSEENMKLVAGVFFNRLAAGMKLQSSVTVCYALYDKYKSWVDCESNPDLDSKYNTYVYQGLPIGPICNPTATALEAVLEPTESDYLYFMASVVSGKMHFATTYAQHEANVKKYLYEK